MSANHVLIGHTERINLIKKLNHNQIVSVSDDKTIRIWNISDGMLVRTFTQHSSRIQALEILEENRFATGSCDNSIRIWSHTHHEFRFNAHNDCILYLKRINSTHLASSSTDKLIKLWNLKTKEFVRDFIGHESGSIRSLEYLNNRTLISVSSDGTIKFWNIDTGSLLNSLWHNSFGRFLAIFNNFTQLFLSHNHIIRTFDLSTSNSILNSSFPANGTISIGVQHCFEVLLNGTFILATNNGFVVLWTGHSEQPLGYFHNSKIITAIADLKNPCKILLIK